VGRHSCCAELQLRPVESPETAASSLPTPVSGCTQPGPIDPPPVKPNAIFEGTNPSEPERTERPAIQAALPQLTENIEGTNPSEPERTERPAIQAALPQPTKVFEGTNPSTPNPSGPSSAKPIVKEPTTGFEGTNPPAPSRPPHPASGASSKDVHGPLRANSATPNRDPKRALPVALRTAHVSRRAPDSVPSPALRTAHVRVCEKIPLCENGQKCT
jgi:hypothetical protein